MLCWAKRAIHHEQNSMESPSTSSSRKNWIFRLLRPLCTSFDILLPPTTHFHVPSWIPCLPWNARKLALFCLRAEHTLPFSFSSLFFPSIRSTTRQRISSPRFKFESSLPRCLHEPVAIPSRFSLGKGNTGSRYFCYFKF